MFDTEDDKSNYRFHFNGDNRSINFNVTNEDAVSWMDVVDQFLDFLGSVYGYSLKDQVQYKEYTFKTTLRDKIYEDSSS